MTRSPRPSFSPASLGSNTTGRIRISPRCGSMTGLPSTSTSAGSLNHPIFMVGEAEFAAIFHRVKAEGIAYGSGPRSRTDRQINHRNGGRGVYFDDPNGHVLEILTA